MKKHCYLKGITVALAMSSLSGLAQACNEEPTIGSVCVFTMDWCPRGYQKADGSALSVNSNQALFSLIGYRYGGNNADQFNVPDLRGRSVVGTGQSPELPAAITIAQKVGQQLVALTASQTPVQPHTHPATMTPTTGPAQISIPATTGDLNVTASLLVSPAVGSVIGQTVGLASGATGYLAAMTGTTGVDPITFTGPYTSSKPGSNSAFLEADVKLTGTASTAAANITVQTVTGGTVTVNPNTVVPAAVPVSTQSPALGLTVCIATQGLYPSRP